MGCEGEKAEQGEESGKGGKGGERGARVKGRGEPRRQHCSVMLFLLVRLLCFMLVPSPETHQGKCVYISHLWLCLLNSGEADSRKTLIGDRKHSRTNRITTNKFVLQVR